MKFIVAAALGLVSAKTELMTAEDYQFMKFVSEHGRSYATKAEFEFDPNTGDVVKTSFLSLDLLTLAKVLGITY